VSTDVVDMIDQWLVEREKNQISLRPPGFFSLLPLSVVRIDWSPVLQTLCERLNKFFAITILTDISIQIST